MNNLQSGSWGAVKSRGPGGGPTGCSVLFLVPVPQHLVRQLAGHHTVASSNRWRLLRPIHLSSCPAFLGSVLPFLCGAMTLTSSSSSRLQRFLGFHCFPLRGSGAIQWDSFQPCRYVYVYLTQKLLPLSSVLSHPTSALGCGSGAGESSARGWKKTVGLQGRLEQGTGHKGAWSVEICCTFTLCFRVSSLGIYVRLLPLFNDLHFTLLPVTSFLDHHEVAKCNIDETDVENLRTIIKYISLPAFHCKTLHWQSKQQQ